MAASTEKTLLAQVYSPAGTFIKTWSEITFRGFTAQLNSGPGECIVTRAVPFDYDGGDLREGNEVRLTVTDRDTRDFTDEGEFNVGTIYRGYISLIEREIDAQSEVVTVHLLGYYTLLSLDVLKNGSQTTLYSKSTTGLSTTSGDLNPTDVGLMARAVIDRFNAETTSSRISYEAADVPNTGTNATYIFEQKTYREAIDKLKELAPENVYWYVDEIGRFSFKEIPATPTHTFIFGRHFTRVRVERSLETVRNVLLLWDGASTYKSYTDTGSIALYGRRVARINDFGSSNVNAMAALAAKFLAENKEPGSKLICTILDNNNVRDMGYDIESIRPGDTCRLLGFSSELSDIFRDNMLITRVNYTLEAVEIEVELVKSGLLDVQARQSREISDISSGGLGIPTTYS
jgi:hypothetical protein